MAPRLWLAPRPLILASASTTRRDMLAAAGLAVETRAAEIDERAVEAELPAGHDDPRAVALALAAAKAGAVSRACPGRFVLGADQTLDCGGERLHKPGSLDAARRQLRRLSGRSHRLCSAFAIMRDGALLADGASEARLAVRPLGEAFLDAYLAETGPAVLASVGAYQLERLGAHLFESVSGDHFTILGLPLIEALAAMRRLGLIQD